MYFLQSLLKITYVSFCFRCVDALPPTTDAAKLHIARAHLQAAIWRQADRTVPILPNPEDTGWMKTNTGYKPRFTTLETVPPQCRASTTCQCSVRGCYTAEGHCKCRTGDMICTILCRCQASLVCQNKQ